MTVEADFDAEIREGSQFLRKNLVREAIEKFQIAIEIRPGAAEAWFQLAAALDESGDFLEAIRCLETAVDLNPDWQSPRLKLLRLYDLVPRSATTRQSLLRKRQAMLAAVFRTAKQRAIKTE